MLTSSDATVMGRQRQTPWVSAPVKRNRGEMRGGKKEKRKEEEGDGHDGVLRVVAGDGCRRRLEQQRRGRLGRKDRELLSRPCVEDEHEHGAWGRWLDEGIQRRRWLGG